MCVLEFENVCIGEWDQNNWEFEYIYMGECDQVYVSVGMCVWDNGKAKNQVNVGAPGTHRHTHVL